MEKHRSYIFSFSIFLIKTALLLIAIGFILNLSLEKLVINKTSTTGASKIDRMISMNNILEIPILGSSRAEGNFLPSILGDNYYNYGIAGTQANIWMFLLEQELAKNKTEPIIINFDLRGIVYADGDIKNYLPNWNKTKTILSDKGEFYYQVPFLKYFGQFEKYFASYIQEKTHLTIHTDKGAVLQKNSVTIEKFSTMVDERKRTKSSAKINKKLSKKLLSLINSTKRKIILVISPYHNSCFNNNVDYSKSDTYLKELKTINNISILDLRNFITDDEMFLNTTHLNYNGAIKFSKKIKELINEMSTSHNEN